ncbi:MAG: DUF1479 domain-containing protein [Proteobacteria bacterium]|nr:DUF1479 domain-containing protein [Pseudomonadota bacterium]
MSATDRPRPSIGLQKRALRAAIPRFEQTFAEVEQRTRGEAELIAQGAARGDRVIPEVAYQALCGGDIPGPIAAEIRRRGVVIVRGTFPRAQAEAWDAQLADYIVKNGYYRQHKRSAGDQYFSTLHDNQPQIFAIYWSRPQVEARQSQRLAITRAALNRLWRWDTPGAGGDYVPGRECTYADRIRRRRPGDGTLGLSPHVDGGSVERWLDPGYLRVYRHVFSAAWRDHDPFDAGYRGDTEKIASPAVCSMFRTFQGWTALSEQGPNDGTLQLVPMADAMVYLLMRSLADDVPDDVLCGAEPGRALSITPRWHAPVLQGLVSIPRVYAGDTVWWHPDLIHAVENTHNGTGYSNVMYIAAAPWCSKNAAYLQEQKSAFLRGESSPDFAAEHVEVEYPDRARRDDLTELGLRQMGFVPW